MIGKWVRIFGNFGIFFFILTYFGHFSGFISLHTQNIFIKPICMFMILIELVNTALLIYILCLSVYFGWSYHEKTRFWLNFDLFFGPKSDQNGQNSKIWKIKKKEISQMTSIVDRGLCQAWLASVPLPHIAPTSHQTSL